MVFFRLSIRRSVPKGGAEIASTGKRKYGKRKYRISVVLIVEITMELPLLDEWVSLCLGFYLHGGPKMAPFLYALKNKIILTNFPNYFTISRNRENISNNTVTKDPTTPQVCLYTTLWNVSVLKATIENKTTSVSVTTHFKKLTTGNNVFIVSVIV